ncbi:MAG: protein-disulfide reductase DsbD [Gammaproteobacteria bacterium]|nr:protein-disulfide reductase DsbD [Gammaproteobacteria bacterium]MBU0848181.1 protein-disulfide reductase DsbD [Gammaproteobacteria bacterium]MBU1266399.1 protein-disulfide reductase DsbD [Gammaproteobacteria bacterium]MBU1527888.1 protein-disulfide reductase DsbD [Gammaproteobacteria bacterium]MBU1779782.1 protein-disulfide reductase DsbD [Gammaproteobacteria bacterium]
MSVFRQALVNALQTSFLCVALWAGSATAQDNDFLPPEEAFQFKLSAQDPGCVENCLIDVRATVAPEYYLYRERFALENPNGLPVFEFVELPRGDRKFDEFLNQEIEALRGEMAFQIRYSLGDASPADAAAVMVSQGCADAGLCYPPMSTPVAFKESSLLGGVLGGSGMGSFFGKKEDVSAPSSVPSTLPADEAGDLASRLADQSWLVVLPVFFGLGLLLAFTPCTLPMLPIVSSLVVGQQTGAGAAAGKARPMALALVYVLGMALTYALLGVLAGLTGQSLVMAMQQPSVLWAFGGILGLLGVALLMGYSLQLPASFQSWLQEKTGRLKGGQFVPVLVMGVLSALLLGPCVAPPLAGALLYIGQSGDAVLGGAALFLLALGMGLPLVLFAAGAGAALPKAGAWMSWVSAAFGFVLLAVAVWTITPVTPVWLIMAMWALLASMVAAALFHGAVSMATMGTRGKVLSKTFGLMFSLLALIYLMGLFSGSSSLLQPLAGLGGAGSGSLSGSVATSMQGKPDFEKVSSDDVVALIAASKQPVMLDFYADWCVSCKEFELFTLTDANVKDKLKGVRLVQVDVTDSTADDRALLKQFNLFGPPAILFFLAGETESIHTVIGFQNARRFDETLAQIRPNLGL